MPIRYESLRQRPVCDQNPRGQGRNYFGRSGLCLGLYCFEAWFVRGHDSVVPSRWSPRPHRRTFSSIEMVVLSRDRSTVTNTSAADCHPDRGDRVRSDLYQVLHACFVGLGTKAGGWTLSWPGRVPSLSLAVSGMPSWVRWVDSEWQLHGLYRINYWNITKTFVILVKS